MESSMLHRLQVRLRLTWIWSGPVYKFCDIMGCWPKLTFFGITMFMKGLDRHFLFLGMTERRKIKLLTKHFGFLLGQNTFVVWHRRHILAPAHLNLAQGCHSVAWPGGFRLTWASIAHVSLRVCYPLPFDGLTGGNIKLRTILLACNCHPSPVRWNTFL